MADVLAHDAEDAEAMTLTACDHVDVALSLQQTIRERDVAGRVSGQAIGRACGQPSVGFVEDIDGSRRHFCALHPLEAPIVRD
jgi:hypothetical protein